MAHQVLWTDKLTEEFIQKGALSEDEAYIMRTRVRGYTVQQQSNYLSKSPATIGRMIKHLKKKYDAVQKEYPDIFPIRKVSKIEEFMDEN